MVAVEDERSGAGVEIHFEGNGMKINIGCGSRVMDGWFNCDIARDPNAPRDPEMLCDAK